MFCNQCEQTSRGVACTIAGVCGKKADTAAMQDLLLHALKDLSTYVIKARENGLVVDKGVGRFTAEALFATLTNVNFDPARLQEYIIKCQQIKIELKEGLDKAGYQVTKVGFEPIGTLEEMIQRGEQKGYLVDLDQNEDIRSLQEILVHGLKGVAAYAHHAAILGREDDRLYRFFYEALAATNDRDKDLSFWLDMVLKCGEINLLAMEMLDDGNTSYFGHPVPTSVPLGHKAGKSILVSGHDLYDLKLLLEATQGTGINIYTHGEMLPAHGYPELKKYPHFYGHFGTAWQNQKQEFAEFPGPILMTTNCLLEPKDSYFNSIFTTGPVAWPEVQHLTNSNFGLLIDKALSMPGFTEDSDRGSVMVGFARNAVLSVADKIIEMVKNGEVRHFFLVGGCDGARSSRSYYTDFVKNTPQDTLVLTLGCGKFRFFDQKLGSIQEIPRLLDLGQCNDAYSAIQIALALANAFDCGVNDLPLSLVLSWFEQKAVSILLSLLYLGIKDIRLGPTLPAFISPGVLDVLVKNFDIKPISSVDADLAAILG